MGASRRGRSCRVCGKRVDQFGVCKRCGTPHRPFPDDCWDPRNWRAYLVAAALFVCAVIAIGEYVVSEPGPARLLELAVIAGGPALAIGVGWLAYRIWVRKRYPDD